VPGADSSPMLILKIATDRSLTTLRVLSPEGNNKSIIDALAECGYAAACFALSAVEIFLPQDRTRLYWVGVNMAKIQDDCARSGVAPFEKEIFFNNMGSDLHRIRCSLYKVRLDRLILHPEHHLVQKCLAEASDKPKCKKQKMSGGAAAKWLQHHKTIYTNSGFPWIGPTAHESVVHGGWSFPAREQDLMHFAETKFGKPKDKDIHSFDVPGSQFDFFHLSTFGFWHDSALLCLVACS
jgi:site-specific DNA-cytosine methylase